MIPVERFLSYVEATPTCWEWRGYRQPNGYGMFWLDGSKDVAHRVSYTLFVGPIPDGLHIDHLCKNRGCVRPIHLEAVTQAENNRRVNPERKTCKRAGHDLSDAYIEVTRWGATYRRCRTCTRERQKEARS